MRKNEIPNFSQPEINYIRCNANFSIRELHLFDLYNQGATIEESAEIMGYSVATISRIAKAMINKIIRVL